MRILLVNDFAYGGGCEQHVAQIMDFLLDAGQDVDRFVGTHHPAAPTGPLAYIANKDACRNLRERLELFRPDVVHVHNFYHVLSPAILGELKRWKKQGSNRRVVMTAHDFHLVCPNPGFNRFKGSSPDPLPDSTSVPIGLLRLLTTKWDHRGWMHSWLRVAQHIWNYRLLRRHRVIDRVLAPSELLSHTLRRARIPAVHLPNPAPEVAGSRDVRPNDRLHLVFVGRLEPEKGLLEFLRHVPTEPRFRMSVVGDGTERTAIERLSTQRQLALTQRGRVPHDEAMLAIAHAHVLVLPSLCHENAPLVLLEALSLGTNILVNDRGGMREMVEEAGVGWRANMLDASSVEQALRSIEAARKAGTLNSFKRPKMLDLRSAKRWVPHLLAHYRGEHVPD